MENSVYLGIWTNWSRGPIFGATFTATKEYGNLLISFTALFIGFVASRFWSTVCLGLHRLYSTSNPGDLIYHRRQVTLRNSTAPEAGLWTIVKLLWAWRKLRVKCLTQILPVGILALFCLTAFTIAGVFSSSISNAIGDEVLIQSSNYSTIRSSFMSEFLSNAANYAQQCYDTESSISSNASTIACNKFVVKNLPTASVNHSARCPFDEKLCHNRTSNIRLDTGHISNDELGFNIPGSDGFAWRYVLHCAPLTTKGYTTHVIDENGNGKTTYGNLIPELTRLDGDTTIVSLSGNGVFFSQRMDDDWYRATEAAGVLVDVLASGNITSYIPRVAASPMGCVEQWQWCKTSSSKDQTTCGPLASLSDSFYGAFDLFNLTNENVNTEPRPSTTGLSGSRFLWPSLSTIQSPTTLDTMLAHLGEKSLVSQTRLFSGIQWPLPDNQWHLDVTQWWHTILAGVQASWSVYVNTAHGPNDPMYREILWPPLNDAEKQLCNSQKIRSSQHTSFSLFGLLFTYITGILIVLTSYTLEPLLGCLYRRRKYQPYAHFEWMMNTSLQLHRLAHEENGLYKWSNCTHEVPVLEPNCLLASLDISDPTHPKLSREGTTSNVVRNDIEVKTIEELTDQGLSIDVDPGPSSGGQREPPTPPTKQNHHLSVRISNDGRHREMCLVYDLRVSPECP
ncbi:hypothetical protein F5Y12DRAFT_786163 [Xylaria sp. FL1777]|nr:hypothetical protein F5Y12DRAFT_786163 [Xylaria sp. FL1777]